MKGIKYFILFYCLMQSDLKAEVGVVGYIQFDRLSNDEWALHLISGGAKAIRKVSDTSDLHICADFKSTVMDLSYEYSSCSLRVTPEGFGNVGNLFPLSSDDSKSLASRSKPDNPFEYPFAAGPYSVDPSKILVWVRGEGAKKLYEILHELSPDQAHDDLYQGPNLSCYRRYTTLHTRAGPSLYRPYLHWCKFLVTSGGKIEPYPIPQAVLDDMKSRDVLRKKE